jgi:hypothetical protein
MPAATNRNKKKLICHPFVLRTKLKKKKKCFNFLNPNFPGTLPPPIVFISFSYRCPIYHSVYSRVLIPEMQGKNIDHLYGSPSEVTGLHSQNETLFVVCFTVIKIKLRLDNNRGIRLRIHGVTSAQTSNLIYTNKWIIHGPQTLKSS